jgi:hypothetical protein
MSWKDAHVGTGTGQVSLRVTDEEKQRLEHLRQEFRLTSKGQVIRAALDLLEGATVGTDFLAGREPEPTRRAMRRVRRHVGVPRRADVQAAVADDSVAKRRTVVTSYRHVVDSGAADGGLPDTAAPNQEGEKS